MIGICTDSGAQLPLDLADRLRIAVVPLTVTVADRSYLEGVDLDADGFWARFEGAEPSVATAAPSPGRFVEAWSELAAAGATEIVSVHTGSQLSGTFNAATLAARQAGLPVPVRLVDTASASFVVGLAAWAAADAARAGADAGEVASLAEMVADRCGNVFVVGTLAWAQAGGRLAVDAGAGAAAGPADPTEGSAGLPVLALVEGEIRTIGHSADAAAAAEQMADHVLAAGRSLRVGVGHGDPSSLPVADALADRIRSSGQPVELMRYRVGPSIGAHTGPGTAGAVFHPRW